MLYLPRVWLRRGLGVHETLPDDVRLGGAIMVACAAVVAGAGQLERDAVLDAVVHLLRVHLGCTTRDSRVTRRARERLLDMPTDDIGADALARACGATALVQQVAQYLSGDAERARRVSDDEAQRCDAFFADQFSGIGRVFVGIVSAPQR